MTKQQAEEILKAPKFGDPDCIAAARRMADEPEVLRLRSRLSSGGIYVVCGACGGDCSLCNVCGAAGAIEITRELADSWELDTLREVFKETGLDAN
jgi:hypothetical protein